MSAPETAIHNELQTVLVYGSIGVLRPLIDRVHFKNVASKQMLAGAVILSLALILSANLVVSEVVGHQIGGLVAAAITTLIVALWWCYPWWLRRRLHKQNTPFRPSLGDVLRD